MMVSEHLLSAAVFSRFIEAGRSSNKDEGSPDAGRVAPLMDGLIKVVIDTRRDQVDPGLIVNTWEVPATCLGWPCSSVDKQSPSTLLKLGLSFQHCGQQ